MVFSIKEGYVNPEEVGGGAEHQEGHGLLEGFHPCAGFGQVSGQDGKGAQNDVGKGHSKPHHGQAEYDAQRRLEHGRADSLAQERSAARGGDDRSQGTGPKGAGITFPVLEVVAHGRGFDAYFKDAEHAQPHGEHQAQQTEIHPGVFKPERPVDNALRAAAQPEVSAEHAGAGWGAPVKHVRFQRNQNGSNEPERNQDAQYEGKGVGQHFFPFPPSQLDESHNLEADYREDARHDIEDDAADEHEEHDFPQAHQRRSGDGSGRFRGGFRSGGCCLRFPGEGAVVRGDDDAFPAGAQDAGKAGQRFPFVRVRQVVGIKAVRGVIELHGQLIIGVIQFFEDLGSGRVDFPLIAEKIDGILRNGASVCPEVQGDGFPFLGNPGFQPFRPVGGGKPCHVPGQFRRVRGCLPVSALQCDAEVSGFRGGALFRAHLPRHGGGEHRFRGGILFRSYPERHFSLPAVSVKIHKPFPQFRDLPEGAFHPEAGHRLEGGFHGKSHGSRIFVVNVPVVRQRQLRHDDEGGFSIGGDSGLGGTGCLGRTKVSRFPEAHASEVLGLPRAETPGDHAQAADGCFQKVSHSKGGYHKERGDSMFVCCMAGSLV